MVVAILQSANRHDVNPSTQERLERFLEIHQVEQRTSGVELDQEIEVAVSVVIAAGDRPEQRNTSSVVAPNEFVDLVAPRFHDRPASTHAL